MWNIVVMLAGMVTSLLAGFHLGQSRAANSVAQFEDKVAGIVKELQSCIAKLPYQIRVQEWMLKCFGPTITADKVERSHRFLEEALELMQACDCSASEAHQLVEYVYKRPVGELHQEVGGVMVTLAALCNTHDLNMGDAAEKELARVWGHIDKIRAKQATKSKFSPLPE